MPHVCAGLRLPDGLGIGYLALGDSYTIGEGVAPEQRWPVQLAADLRAQGVDVAAPKIIAANGWTTDELSAAIDAAEAIDAIDAADAAEAADAADAADAARQLQQTYGLVTLGIGVNDQYRGRTLDSFAPAFRMLLERAIAFAGSDARRVLVPSIPDWGTTPYAIASGRDRGAIARDIDAYNSVAHAICAQRGVAWVDVTTLGRREHNLGLLVDDGLHPSAALYLQWVARIVPVLLARLGLATHRA